MNTADDAARMYLALGRLHRALRRDARDAAVSHGSLSALATLSTEGPLRPSVLAGLEGVSAPAMTRVLTTLEGLGYVHRTVDPADRRASLVSATPAGAELVTAGRTARTAALQRRIDELDQADRDRVTIAIGLIEALTAEPS